MSGKYILKYSITLYCEMIWLYFALIVWSKLEWEVETSPLMILFIVPTILAVFLYLITRTFIRNFYVQYSSILIVFFMYIYFLWNQVAPHGGLAYELTVCAVAFHLFLRSLYFLNKEPKRINMLIRFEGNIFIYIFLVLFFQANPVLTVNLHIYFFVAIILSLAGMVLTLYPDETSNDGEEDVEIRKVGNVGWLPYAVASVFLIIIASGFLLLLPGVHSVVTSTLLAAWNILLKVGSIIQSVLLWIMSLFPTPDSGGPLEMEPGMAPSMVEGKEEIPQVSLPLFEILTVVAGAGILLGLWFLLKGLKKRSLPQRVNQRRKFIKRSKSFSLFGWLKRLFNKGFRAVARNFSFYYENDAYWEFYKLSKWGRKQGYPRLSTETPHEYAAKLTALPLFSEHESGTLKYTKESINKLINDYTAAYYGKQSETTH
ncbi:hypothetical protein [Bacillus sp. Marseille-P3661]|uniref:hypothetical protein n=1 Tax=Bacillus sp. Marseille-P3661 TaxID=1936234 RepID=UPI00115AA7FA|nr:hypothetical protein [Bacillus sp. Marseille-P3661]